MTPHVPSLVLCLLSNAFGTLLEGNIPVYLYFLAYVGNFHDAGPINFVGLVFFDFVIILRYG